MHKKGKGKPFITAQALHGIHIGLLVVHDCIDTDSWAY